MASGKPDECIGCGRMVLSGRLACSLCQRTSFTMTIPRQRDHDDTPNPEGEDG